jgi:Protein of unknown function (DUF1688)
MINDWKVNEENCDKFEGTHRLVFFFFFFFFFFVSVLLDAGAGDHWRYNEPGTEQEYERSEGIEVASVYMF